MHIFFKCSGAAISALMIGASANATTNAATNAAAENADIEEIIVQGRYLSLDKLNAVKTPTPVINVPQSLTIIGSEQISRQAFTNIGDITRYSPGVSNSQGEGHRDAIIIRGIQTTADFYIDGVRDDVQYFRPLYNLERIEILRGANALLFGRGGGGGIVNRVTKSPEFDGDFFGYAAAVDTFGAHSFSGDLNYTVGDDAAFRLNGFYENLNNHRDFFGGERFAINPTFAFKPLEDTNLLLSYEYVNDDRVVDRGVPSQNVDGGPDIPLEGFQNTFFGSPDQNLSTLKAHILKARVDHDFSDNLRGNFSAQYADYGKAYQNLFPSEEVVVTNGTFPEVELDGYRDTTQRENLIFQANLVGQFETGGLGHTVLLGLEYGNQDSENARLDTVFADNGDDQLVIPFTDPLNIPAFDYSNLVRDRASEVETLSVYLQDQIDLTEQLKVVVGARFDRFDISVNDITSGGQFGRKDEVVSPRFGVIYKPAENVSFYGSYSESFLPRSGEQFLTLNLDTESTRPQSFENKEIGAKWDIRPDLSLAAAIFELDRESFTSVDPEDVGQLIVIEGSKTKGFEIQLTGNLTEQLFVTTSYTYLDGDVERVDGSGNSGNRTRQTPESMVTFWGNYQINERFGLGLGVTHQSSFFVREDNSVEVPGYTRVDAAVYYELNDQVRLQLNAENLFDADYFPDAHSNDNISTGKPLNVRFSVSGRF